MVVDAGDPATWAAHVMRDRFQGDVPHLLFPAAEFDAIHSVERAKEVGSLTDILAAEDLRASVIEALDTANARG